MRLISGLLGLNFGKSPYFEFNSQKKFKNTVKSYLCYNLETKGVLVVLITVLGGFLETFVIILIGYRLIGISLKDKIIPISVVSFYGSVILMMVKGSLPSATYLIVTILAIGFLLTFVININTFASVIAISLGCLSLLISDVLGFLLVRKVLRLELGELSPLFIITPNILIMAAIYVILKKNNYYIPIPLKKKKNNKNNKVLSVLLFLLSSLFLFYIFVFEINQFELLSIPSASVLVLITLTVFYLVHYHVVRKVEELAVSIDGQYEEDIVKQITIIRSQRHDFIHHMLAMKQMLNNGNFDESVDYVNSVIEETTFTSDVLPVASEAIGGVLLSYKEKAAKNGINVFYHITDDLVSLPCKIFEVNRILGNLILNAIEAVYQLEEEKRYVNMKIYRNDVCYVIEVSNYIDVTIVEESIENIFDPGFTTKLNTSNTGQGLSIIENLVTQYGGYIYPNITDDMITFNVSIPYGGHYV